MFNKKNYYKIYKLCEPIMLMITNCSKNKWYEWMYQNLIFCKYLEIQLIKRANKTKRNIYLRNQWRLSKPIPTISHSRPITAMRLFAVAPAAASVRVHAAAAASQHCIPSGQSVGAQADAAPAAQEVHHLAPQKPKTSAKARVHVAIDDRIVAAVGHGQPVACEPDVRQRPPLGDVVVVQLELNSAVLPRTQTKC